jgi:putative acetyltransferase
MNRVKICPASAAAEIADLFHAAVHAIDDHLYATHEKLAWAPSPVDYHFWARRLARSRPGIIEVDERIAGFIELTTQGLIDCLYVHPDFQNRGVASALYEHAETKARSLDAPRLTVHASIVAEPFFRHRGFTLIREQTVSRNGCELRNFLMEKVLR